MVKSIHTLTIRDYSLFDKTGDMKYLSVGMNLSCHFLKTENGNLASSGFTVTIMLQRLRARYCSGK